MASTAAAPGAAAVPIQSGGQEYCSWGRYPRAGHDSIYRPDTSDALPAILHNAAPSALLPYGLGRSYGDSCLNQGRTLVDCSRLNRILDADFQAGWIRCEAGTTLADIIATALPRGWFLPVTPGTKFVTVAGAIANDVHGKNHHRAGTFGCHVRQFALCRSDAGLTICSPESNPGLFCATIGGLGLTGVIAWAEIQLQPVRGGFIDVQTIPFRSPEEFLQLTAESDTAFEYTVAWLDCFSRRLGKGIFFRGNHSQAPGVPPPAGIRLKLPFDFPGWALNGATIRAFNAAYFLRNRMKSRKSTVAYEPFFYPLDSVGRWNRMYGRRGFLQYQCVVPAIAIERLLRLAAESAKGSFLTVLKQFGARRSPGMLSFPRPGLTLTLDFAMKGEPTLRLLNALDEVVLDAGGALYPAKDARMSPRMFALSFPGWREFRPYVDEKISSSFWRRVTASL